MSSGLRLDVGARVRAAREAQGLTTREVAARAGLPHGSRVTKIEQGRGVTLDALQAIALALGLDLKELLP